MEYDLSAESGCHHQGKVKRKHEDLIIAPDQTTQRKGGERQPGDKDDEETLEELRVQSTGWSWRSCLYLQLAPVQGHLFGLSTLVYFFKPVCPFCSNIFYLCPLPPPHLVLVFLALKRASRYKVM
ncbi:unnamed protein product [Nezara viridula]|uniref:Uncharacterized protein n=1 Tax=Nezara viridula TaxID=85310 RepID=A0A9P0E8V2_NEZVI|nr:unnamed protein product [Nezara viridula]